MTWSVCAVQLQAGASLTIGRRRFPMGIGPRGRGSLSYSWVHTHTHTDIYIHKLLFASFILLGLTHYTPWSLPHPSRVDTHGRGCCRFASDGGALLPPRG